MTDDDYLLSYELRVKILEAKILEQADAFDKMRNKMFAIVGLLLTLAGLLTYDVFKIKRPDTPIEWIIFVASVLAFTITALLISYDYRAKKDWPVPIGPVDEVNLNNLTSYKQVLSYMHEDILQVYRDRSNLLKRKAFFLNTSLYLFILSVILLVVLKIGG